MQFSHILPNPRPCGPLALLVLAVPLLANHFFTAPSGTHSGDGSLWNPWDLQTALNQPRGVAPGDTIWVLGGVYKAPTSNGFQSHLNGTPDSPIIVRAHPYERATIDGKGTQFGLAVYGSYTWFWGLEVTDSTTVRAADASNNPPNSFGVADYGPGTKFINMIVHDTAQGFSGYNTSPDAEFYGNSVYYNGYMGTDRQHGHGMYLQNLTGQKVIADNIVGENFDEGIQIYGSATANLEGFLVQGNALFNSSPFSGYDYQYNLFIGGGGVRRDVQVLDNYSYFTPERDYGFVQLGQYTPGDNLTVTNNTFAGGYVGVDMSSQNGPVVFTGNTLYVLPSAVQMVNLQIPSASSMASYTWDKNTYYGLNRFFFGINLTFSDWQGSTGFDRFSHLSENPPAGAWVYIRPNAYESNRANIVIYNWDMANTVSVDVSGVLRVGVRYALLDPENFFGAPLLSGIYSGGYLAIPMNGTAKAAPNGVAAPPSVGPGFGAFILIAAEQIARTRR
jgi:hypothetical protein